MSPRGPPYQQVIKATLPFWLMVFSVVLSRKSWRPDDHFGSRSRRRRRPLERELLHLNWWLYNAATGVIICRLPDGVRYQAGCRDDGHGRRGRSSRPRSSTIPASPSSTCSVCSSNSDDYSSTCATTRCKRGSRHDHPVRLADGVHIQHFQLLLCDADLGAHLGIAANSIKIMVIIFVMQAGIHDVLSWTGFQSRCSPSSRMPTSPWCPRHPPKPPAQADAEKAPAIASTEQTLTDILIDLHMSGFRLRVIWYWGRDKWLRRCGDIMAVLTITTS